MKIRVITPLSLVDPVSVRPCRAEQVVSNESVLTVVAIRDAYSQRFADEPTGPSPIACFLVVDVFFDPPSAYVR